MAERSEVLRVQNDALLNEYHQLIVAQVRRIDEALAVLDRERNNLLTEKEHLLKHLPQTDAEPPSEPVKLPRHKDQQELMPKFLQKGPAGG